MGNGAGLVPGGGPLNINIDVKDLAPVVCQGVVKETGKLCDSTVFIQAFELRVLPALMSGQAADTIIQVPAYICTTCKAIVRTTEESATIKAAARRTTRGTGAKAE